MFTKIRIKKLNENAKIPVYSSEEAAGADLYALNGCDITIKPGETKLIHTQVSLHIPKGLVGLVYARSGLATKKGLAPANKVGVIDSDYRGEIMVPLHNHSNTDQMVGDGERIAQMIFMPYIQGAFEEVDTLDETERGDKGFGSTGLKN